MTALPDVMPIDEYVCLSLYRASRAVTGLYRDLLSGLDLTYPQYLVMRLLWQRGALPVREIGEALQLDYGTLSPLLKRLEAAGLIDRRRNAEDERSVTIQLTDGGRALEARAADVPAKLMLALGLSGKETAELRETLARLTASVAQRHSARG